MPTYEFRCPHCGPFERRRELAESGDPTTCPQCGVYARRIYSVPGVRTSGGPIAHASAQDRARYDRSRTGEPVVTGPPTGQRLRKQLRHNH